MNFLATISKEIDKSVVASTMKESAFNLLTSKI